MNWDKYEKKFKRTLHHLNIKAMGIRVFEILRVYEPVKVENDYTFASSKYMKWCKKERDVKESYHVVDMDIKVKFWVNKEMNGQLSKISMSEKMFNKIIDVRLQLQHYKWEVPKYVIYWKLDRMHVWVAYITEEKYQMLKELLVDFDYSNSLLREKVKETVAWYGNKAWCPLSKMERWYK